MDSKECRYFAMNRIEQKNLFREIHYYMLKDNRIMMTLFFFMVTRPVFCEVSMF